MNCPTCGADVPNGMSVCLECGAIVGGAPAAKGQTYFNNTAQRLNDANKNALRGLRGPMGWLWKLLLVQALVYVVRMVSALVLIAVLSNESWLFSEAGFNTISFLEKLSKNMIWVQIVVTALTLVTLYVLGGYKKPFTIAGLFLAIGVTLNLLAERQNVSLVLLAMDLGEILCDIIFAIILFTQMSKIAEPFNRGVAENWKRLITWYIIIYIGTGVMAYYMIYSVETLKGLNFCLAISGFLMLIVEVVVYKMAKKTYELLL